MIDDLDVPEAAPLFYDMTVSRRVLSTIIAFDPPDMSDAQIAARIDVFVRGYLQFRC